MKPTLCGGVPSHDDGDDGYGGRDGAVGNSSSSSTFRWLDSFFGPVSLLP